ncbi:MAG TPA: hypothetical protein VMA83_06760 [Solirubrobacteraceae bacterium]|nr:hypothetical protein [Solirubrobacteraceae bacterium]
MLRVLRQRLSYANVVSTIALCLALGGVSYAAVELPAGSVGTRQLRDGSVTPDKLAFPLGASSGITVRTRVIVKPDQGSKTELARDVISVRRRSEVLVVGSACFVAEGGAGDVYVAVDDGNRSVLAETEGELSTANKLRTNVETSVVTTLAAGRHPILLIAGSGNNGTEKIATKSGFGASCPQLSVLILPPG